MFESGQYRRAALYVTLSVVLSLVATFAGFALAQSALTFRSRA
jgi:fluoride ion exporter CrcB/FEX